MTTASTTTLTAADITTFTAQVTNIAILASEGQSPLSPNERLHMEKARTQVLLVIPALIVLAKKQQIDPASIARLLASKASADLLAPLVDDLAVLLRILGDVLLVYRRDASLEARVLFGQLKAQAKGNSALAKSLQPLAAAFRVAPRNPKAKKSQKSGATAAASTTPEATVAAAAEPEPAPAETPPHA